MYKRWQALHLRYARREALNAEEQAVYEAGCRALDAEEDYPAVIAELQHARRRAEELEAERAQLQARYDTLRTEITALEARLDEPTRSVRLM